MLIKMRCYDGCSWRSERNKKRVGCGKAFAVYGLELNDIAEVRNCDEKGESLE